MIVTTNQSLLYQLREMLRVSLKGGINDVKAQYFSRCWIGNVPQKSLLRQENQAERGKGIIPKVVFLLISLWEVDSTPLIFDPISFQYSLLFSPASFYSSYLLHVDIFYVDMEEQFLFLFWDTFFSSVLEYLTSSHKNLCEH